MNAVKNLLTPSPTPSLLCLALAMSLHQAQAQQNAPSKPGSRVLLDAHNCYPYHGLWSDRIDRALAAGLPIAIEHDLVWVPNPKTGKPRSIVSHGEPFSDKEPQMREHFFERVRPIVQKALAAKNTADWPLITLNLDFKNNPPEHHRAVWDLLGQYESWLCTAERIEDENRLATMTLRPVLVLTGSSAAQKSSFHDAVPVGERLRLFGAAPVRNTPDATPEQVILHPATNYQRWVNFPWATAEKGGQKNGGEWTAQDQKRLQALVRRAHDLHLWIRFYTLNGHDPKESKGWGSGYNFGSPQAVRLRWRAAINAGVDFIATDQYEAFSNFKAQSSRTP